MQKIIPMNLKFIIRKNTAIDGMAPFQMQPTVDKEKIQYEPTN